MCVKIYLLLVSAISLCCLETVIAFKIPKVSLEVAQDGFRISIPDEDGIRNVAFHINRNRPFTTSQLGDFSVQIRQPTNGLWVNKFPRKLQTGDVLYVWTNVQHNQLVYRSIVEQFVVGEGDINGINNINNTNIPSVDPKTDYNETNGQNNDNGEERETCEPSITVVQGQKESLCRGQLIFEDTFDGSLNSNRWKQEVRLPLDSGDAEFVLYDTNVNVENGLLNIHPLLWNNDRPGTNIKRGQLDLGRRCTGNQDRVKECSREPDGLVHNTLPPVIAARVSTKESFSFKYGRIDIRAKVPQGDWLYPLLLLEPLTNYYGQNPYMSGQMRVAFVRGNQNLTTSGGENIDGRTLYGGAVLTTDATYREKSMVSTSQAEHLGKEFHVYTLLWSNRKLILKIDEQEYGQVNGGFYDVYSSDLAASIAWRTGQFIAPFDQMFYITLGLSCGGHGDFPDDSISGQYSKPWINTSPRAAYQFWLKRSNWKSTWTNPNLQVDYVRVYAI